MLGLLQPHIYIYTQKKLKLNKFFKIKINISELIISFLLSWQLIFDIFRLYIDIYIYILRKPEIRNTMKFYILQLNLSTIDSNYWI